MEGPPRTTMNVLKILRVLMDDPTAEHYGLEVGKEAGLAGGSLYPVLMRLEKAGLVVSGWEQTDPSEAGRPRRRMYRLTPGGAEYARRELRQAQQSLTPNQQRPPARGRPAGLPALGGALA